MLLNDQCISKLKIVVILPAFKTQKTILPVIGKIGEAVSKIVVVDDCCPVNTGDFVRKNCLDDRVEVLFNEENLGVGGAMITGYKYAIENNYDIAVKIDSDGQMDPLLIPEFILPFQQGNVDYVKGNRFLRPGDLAMMPIHRVIGNAWLSFLNKFASGYWRIFDPTNGYTAIRISILRKINFEQLENRYFFESDMLYHLGVNRGVVMDIPIKGIYADEVSGLSAWGNFFPFLGKMIRNTTRRVFYQYYLRDFSIASLELLLGLLCTSYGVISGALRWYESAHLNVPATGGQVMFSALPIIIGVQCLIAFLNFDILNEPR